MQRDEPRPGAGPAQRGLSTEDLAGAQHKAQATERQPTEPPMYPGQGTPTGAEPAGAEAEKGAPAEAAPEQEEQQLLNTDDEKAFREQWREIQNKFVDDPRDAVHSADALVAEVMQTLASTFSERKQELEAQWNRGEQVSTEDLRTALRRYRWFFNRLLKT